MMRTLATVVLVLSAATCLADDCQTMRANLQALIEQEIVAMDAALSADINVALATSPVNVKQAEIESLADTIENTIDNIAVTETAIDSWQAEVTRLEAQRAAKVQELVQLMQQEPDPVEKPFVHQTWQQLVDGLETELGDTISALNRAQDTVAALQIILALAETALAEDGQTIARLYGELDDLQESLDDARDASDAAWDEVGRIGGLIWEAEADMAGAGCSP